MDEQLFRKTENILYGYYRKVEELERKRRALSSIEQHIADVRRILAEADDLIPSLGVVGQYMVVVGGGGGKASDNTHQSYCEYTKTIEQLQAELRHLMQRKIGLKMRIMKLETEIEGIEFAIGLLDAEEQKIVEQKYLYRRSNLQVGMALGMDESTVRYRRQAIVEKIARSLRVEKGV